MAFPTKPSALPEWATDGYNIVEPTSGRKAEGWLADTKPPAEYFNWWQNNVGAWTKYLTQLGAWKAAVLSAANTWRHVATSGTTGSVAGYPTGAVAYAENGGDSLQGRLYAAANKGSTDEFAFLAFGDDPSPAFAAAASGIMRGLCYGHYTGEPTKPTLLQVGAASDASTAAGGAIWADIDSETMASNAVITLPANSACLNDACFDGTNFIVVGEYYDGTTNSQILTSTWSVVSGAHRPTGFTKRTPAASYTGDMKCCCVGLACVLVGGKGEAIQRSTDGGATWTSVNLYDADGSSGWEVLKLFHLGDGKIAALAGGSSTWMRISMSEDDGATWSAFADITVTRDGADDNLISGRYDFAACAANGVIYLIGRDYAATVPNAAYMMASFDGGASFEVVGRLLIPGSPIAMTYGGDRLALLTSDGEVYMSGCIPQTVL